MSTSFHRTLYALCSSARHLRPRLFVVMLCVMGQATVEAQSRPPVIPLRYAESYRYLADPTNRTEVFDSLKYISLGPTAGTYLSLGGEVRQMYERFENPDGTAQHWLPTRVMVNADVQINDGKFRVFTQIGSGFLLNEEMARPIDVDRLYVLDLFAEARLLNLATSEKTRNDELRLRFGRMEFNYGAARLITIREGPNVRHYWDGGQLMLQKGNWNVDALLVSYGLTTPGSLDDPLFNGEEWLWGVYASRNSTDNNEKSTTLDLYYLGLDDDRRAFFNFNGSETRHTLGVRLAETTGAISFDGEVMGQFGKAGTQQIRAYGASGKVTYAVRTTPSQQIEGSGPSVNLGLMADYWSGDRDSTDGTLNNFNALYPRQGYYRGAGQLFPSNFMDISAFAEAAFRDGPTTSVGYTQYWRTSSQDGIYTGGTGRPTLAPTPGTHNRALGGQVDVSLLWPVTRHLSLSTKYSRFFAAGFVKANPNPQEVQHFFNIIVNYRI